MVLHIAIAAPVSSNNRVHFTAALFLTARKPGEAQLVTLIRQVPDSAARCQNASLVCGEKMLNYRRRQQDMVSRCLLLSPRRCRCLGLESWRRHSQPTSDSFLPHSRRRDFRRRKGMMYKGRERREQRAGETTCLESEGKRKTAMEQHPSNKRPSRLGMQQVGCLQDITVSRGDLTIAAPLLGGLVQVDTLCGC